MKYQVTYKKNALKSLSKIDNAQRKMLISWIEKNLIDTANPRQFGKPLKGNLKEYWRYRVGKYRLIADINDEEINIIIVDSSHRKDAYNSI